MVFSPASGVKWADASMGPSFSLFLFERMNSGECVYFSRGHCRFGARCRNKHVKRTELLNPPAWILSNYQDGEMEIKCETYSFEEVRYTFYEAMKRGEKAVEMCIDNWNAVVNAARGMYCKRLAETLEGATYSEGLSERTVDIRDPANAPLFIGPIVQRREAFLEPEYNYQNRDAPASIPAFGPRIQPGTGMSGEVNRKPSNGMGTGPRKMGKGYELGRIPKEPPIG